MIKSLDISGLSTGAVCAALYNAAKPPRRMGANQLLAGPAVMTEEVGQQAVDRAFENRGYTLSRYDVDYLAGRAMKLVFTDESTIDVTNYEDDNGDGVAEQAISHLRRTGEVLIVPSCSAREWLNHVVDEAIKVYDERDSLGCFAFFYVRVAHHPGTRFILEMPPALGMIYSSLSEGRTEARKAMLAWTI